MASILARSSVVSRSGGHAFSGVALTKGRLICQPFCPETTAVSRTVPRTEALEHRSNRSRRYEAGLPT